MPTEQATPEEIEGTKIETLQSARMLGFWSILQRKWYGRF